MKRYQFQLNSQLVIMIIILAASVFSGINYYYSQTTLRTCLFLSIVTFIFNFFNKSKVTQNIKNFCNVVFIPFIYLVAIIESLGIILNNFNVQVIILIFVYSIIALTIYIPVIRVTIFNIKSVVLRIISIYFLGKCITSLSLPDRTVNFNTIVFSINQTDIIGALWFLIAAYFISKNWWNSTRFNLRFETNQIWLVPILVTVIIWFIVFSSLQIYAEAITNALYDWSSYFSDIQLPIPLYFILSAARAGILEETERWFYMNIVFHAYKKQSRVIVALLVSSIVFGVGHFSIYFFGGPSLESLIPTVITAIGFGWLLGTIYLYFGKIWISMALHALYDLLIFLWNSEPLMRVATPWWAKYTSGPELWIAVSVICCFIISSFLLTGKRRVVVEKHVDMLLEK